MQELHDSFFSTDNTVIRLRKNSKAGYVTRKLETKVTYILLCDFKVKSHVGGYSKIKFIYIYIYFFKINGNNWTRNSHISKFQKLGFSVDYKIFFQVS